MNKRLVYNQEDSAKVFLWVLLLPQLVSLLFACIFASIYETQEQMQQSIFYVVVACTLAQACFAFVLFYYNKKHNISIKVATNFNFKVSLKNGILCALISIIAVFGFVNLVGVFDQLFAWLGISSTSVNVPNNTFGWFLFNVVFLAIIPAILEEFIFRGIVFNGLKKRGVWFASLISALMFAMVHLSISQFVYPIIMGIVFALVFNKTGSLIYSIIVHLCNNFIVVLISYISNFTGRPLAELNTSSALGIVLSVIIAVVASVLIWLIVKFALKPTKSENSNIVNVEHNVVEIEHENEQNKLITPNQNRQNIYTTVALVSGAVLWLIVVIGGLVG